MAASSASSADPLRSTLDNLQLDPRSEADRPYLVAMLRRLGYTERQIDEVVRTGQMPEEAPAPDDGLAPPRDYRIVVPARDSRFELESAAPPATDSPFEDLERVEFEAPEEELEFETVTEEITEFEPAAPDERAAGAEGEDLQWQDADTGEPVPEDAAWQTTEEGAGPEGGEALEEVQEPEPASSFEETSIDTFGNPDAVAGGERKTRVRVRRVRAASREEAERKVAGEGRNVIKSVPVDIVERWGAASGKAKPDEAAREGDDEEES